MIDRLGRVHLSVVLAFVELAASAQTYTYDLAGSTNVVYAGGSDVNYAYYFAGNISGISTTSAPNTNLPAVSILSPPLGSTAYSALLAFSGTATSKNQVILVYYQLNNGPGQPRPPMAGRIGNASPTLAQGRNVFTVFAEDAAGNTSSNSISIIADLPIPWTPSQLGTNLSLWLDASSSSSVAVNGATVSQWGDLSGQGNNVSNSNSSTQPVYQPSGLNGLPTVNFTTSGMGLVGAGNFGVSGSAPRALAAVMDTGLIATGTQKPTVKPSPSPSP